MFGINARIEIGQALRLVTCRLIKAPTRKFSSVRQIKNIKVKKKKKMFLVICHEAFREKNFTLINYVGQARVLPQKKNKAKMIDSVTKLVRRLKDQAFINPFFLL